jgi:hypothetical protein
MRSLALPCVLLASLLGNQIDPPPRTLSDQQVQEAIEIGRTRKVPIVQVGMWLGVSKGDFNVFVEGPLGRVAAAASSALREYRAFEATDVTPELKENVYRVIFRRDFESSRYRSTPVGEVKHVVLQPRRAKGMDGAIQPIRENPANGEALFDRLPDGEFDVVIVTDVQVQKFNVSVKQRAEIR